MNIFAIGVTLLIGLMVILVISSLISRSRNTHGSYHQHVDGTDHAGYLAYPGEVEVKGHDGADWVGGDMSHDEHGGYDSDSDGGGDSGGDAGSGEGGGGGE